MAQIKDFRDYLQEIQDQIAGANSNKVVVDPSQLTKFITDHDSSDNAMLLGVLPVWGNNSPTDADNFMLKGFTEIMVLNKVDYSDNDNIAEIDSYDDLLIIAKAIVPKMLNDHIDKCGIMTFLEPSSIQIVEVWNRTQYNGWNIIFTFGSNLI